MPRILRKMHNLCNELPTKVTDKLLKDSYYRLDLKECYTFRDPRTDEAKAIHYKGTIPSAYAIAGGTVLLARKINGSIKEVLIAAKLSDNEIKNFIKTGKLESKSLNLEEHFVPINLPAFSLHNYKLNAFSFLVLIAFLYWFYIAN